MNFRACYCLRKKLLTLQLHRRSVSSENGQAHRFNALGVQMLSENLHTQIFKEYYVDKYSKKLNDDQLNECIEHLKSFDLLKKNCTPMDDVMFDLPQLKGKNVNEHFINASKDQSLYYAKILHKLVSSQLPPMPKQEVWQKKSGWTKYIPKSNGTFEIKSVPCPDDTALIFDCEVLANLSDLPVIAVAVSCDAWFSWTSDHVLKKSSKLENNIEDLIPMEFDISATNDQGKLIVGHNVGYDRARVKEQYFLQYSNTRFLDTMSMHIAVSGFSSQQRINSKSLSKEENNATLESSWVQAGSMNSLSAVYEYYCGTKMDKTIRDTFLTGTANKVNDDFNLLMEYCAKDVEATYNVLTKLTPLFFQRFPHIVTFAGMLEMGQMYLPINNNWQRYIQSCQQEYSNLTLELKRTLVDLMNDACHLLHEKKYKNDKWLCDLDWTVKHKKMIKNPRKDYIPQKSKSIQFKQSFYTATNLTFEEELLLGKSCTNKLKKRPLLDKVFETANRLSLVSSHFCGAPQWYRELQLKENDCQWSHDSCNLSTLTRATPKLLRMTWLGYPLHYCDKMGWGYLVPSDHNLSNLAETTTNSEDEELLEEVEEKENGKFNSGIIHTPAESVDGLPEGNVFHRLPHKNGPGNNVGSPLSHDFMHHIEVNRLSSSEHTNAHRCLEINKLISYWRSAQKRILTQMKIFLDEQCLPENVKNHPKYNKGLGYGAIVPQVVVSGTVSRRAVERTWLTASNTESNRIGSELKSMIQAPSGYCFVGADVDSQELWIASLLGDASYLSEHGCTALSLMTLQGNKKDGTDLHSKTAQAIGMTRSQAKTFNYARMYGAGKQSALRSYMQHNPNESKQECAKKINKLYNMTKGSICYRLNSEAKWIVKKTNVKISDEAKLTGYATFEDVQKIKRAAQDAFGYSKVIQSKDLADGKKWFGGIESQMFNKLEEIATSSLPQTPVLKSQISTALVPSKVGYSFLPGRMNWVVQSSAVDYLHLLLVNMRCLIKEHNLDARFVLSIHDEVHYLSSEKHKYQVALALQISNLLTRSMFAYQLGMDDLPLSVAFFSCIEIDQVIRKEATDNCVTPSNPSGLEAKYGIPLGESLDIHDVLKITNGKFANN